MVSGNCELDGFQGREKQGSAGRGIVGRRTSARKDILLVSVWGAFNAITRG